MEASSKSEVVTRLSRDLSDITSPARYQWEDAQVEAIKRTVAKDCSPHEFVMFLEIAARYGLDPFAKQIWAAKMGRSDNAQVAIIVGRDGLLNIAERNDHFSGFDSDVVVEGDMLTRDPETGEFRHEWGPDHIGAVGADAKEAKVVGAWAMVWRDDRHKPICFYARMSEYRKANSDIWQKYPSAMIQKCAESVALRKAFSIAGLTVEEEVGRPQDPLTSAAPEIEWGDDPKLAEWLQALVDAANMAKRNSYRKQKLLSLLKGRSDDERRIFAQELVEHIRTVPVPDGQERVIVPDPPEGLTQGYDGDGRIVWHDLLDGSAVEVPLSDTEPEPDPYATEAGS